ncbi:hypothetical protein BU23DRAFT_572734 [Bimuria novae-zelandiae CBS 107.79]|uniref:Uncharacterized protein n=1 Tax=Bimuria novae-zelandiae CBS 107.79 TaxID=1447943 RepID=A0A6A5UUJ0_9PLEO|nr:hypothetical protein BU23DRAFT_572734 [Bimuria novae-zelandiae CBS 107.79]
MFPATCAWHPMYLSSCLLYAAQNDGARLLPRYRTARGALFALSEEDAPSEGMTRTQVHHRGSHSASFSVLISVPRWKLRPIDVASRAMLCCHVIDPLISDLIVGLFIDIAALPMDVSLATIILVYNTWVAAAHARRLNAESISSSTATPLHIVSSMQMQMQVSAHLQCALSSVHFGTYARPPFSPGPSDGPYPPSGLKEFATQFLALPSESLQNPHCALQQNYYRPKKAGPCFVCICTAHCVRYPSSATTYRLREARSLKSLPQAIHLETEIDKAEHRT